MIFNDYYSPMDRNYEISKPVEPMPVEEREYTHPDEVGYSVKDVGMSVPLGISAANVQGVQAKLRTGMSSIEIGFPGAVRGTKQAHTPGMYGYEQRKALDEIRRANEVEFTTHAAYNVMGLTGVDQQGNFSWAHRKVMLDEVKRAIEFAADTAGGGSVVVHTGEFERPLSEQPWARDEKGNLVFRKYIHEPYDAQFKVLDNRTGQVISTVQKDRLVARAMWNRAKEEYDGTDQDGNPCHVTKGDYIDYEGNKIIDPYDIRRGRVPEFDEKSGRFKTEMWSFDDFKKEAEDRNRVKEKETGKQLTPREMLLPEEAYLHATLETQEGTSRGWALYYGQNFDKYVETLKKLRKAKAFYENLDKNLPEEEKWKIMKTEGSRFVTPDLVPPDTKHPLEMIDKSISEMEHYIEQSREAALSQEQQARETRDTRSNIISQVKRMYDAGYRSYAEAGIHAMQKSKDDNNPLVVTMENIFPDRYGGHPDELKDLIYGGRKQMVELLTSPTRDDRQFDRKKQEYVTKQIPNEYYNPKVSKEEAAKMAEKHIKATIDTGHMNMWRKYYIGDQNKSPEENQKDFDKWLLNKFEALAKEGLIGNMHVTDNFGYEDEHLAPGQGNVPIRDIMGILKKYGYEKALTVEPGADASTDQADVWGLMKTWRHFGSPVYGEQGPVRVGSPPRTWTDVQHSYFGQNYPPYFVFGAYSPSNDWTLWSGVQME